MEAMMKIMHKKMKTVLLGLSMSLLLAACGSTQTATSETAASVTEASSEETSTSAESSTEAETTTAESAAEATGDLSALSNSEMAAGVLQAKSGDQELQDMTAEVVDKYTQDEYTDEKTGLSVPYNIFLPENYSADKQYPMVFFIGDMTTAGSAMDYALKQGWGGIVWATAAEQAKNECIVAVPVYPETILDDHDGYFA